MADDGLYLGRELEGDHAVLLDSDHLTTHAACLGMTGSGKTGLGTVMLEELARRSVPLLVIDLKGDMVDLLLNFPRLDPPDFEPWLTSDQIGDRDRSEVAREQAALWRTGLERSGLGPADVRAVREGVRWQLLTPGVASAAPIDILPALSAPVGWQPERDPDATTDRVNGVVGALLSLVGRGGDPLTDRDHVLVSSIVLEHWRRGEALDLPSLLTSIADPPMESLGALPLDSFYERDDRMKLVMELNTLLASPAFAAWTMGTPLEIERLLGTPEAPAASIVSVAHLDERQRLFILGLILSELVSWMRRQPASSGLRALLYMDEVQGILPPHPANPPTKWPLLTLLKQGRAFGVGAWLATQNPVDLDYKALGNAGVKVIGRLITDRDRERAFEGLGVATLDDGRDVDALVASLGKREFLLYDVRATPRVRTFSSRWAMSYLRGPVTLAEMKPLLEESAPAVDASPGRDESSVPDTTGAVRPPVLSASIRQRFETDGEGALHPHLLIRNRVTVVRKTLGLDRTDEETWWIPIGGAGGLDWEAAQRLEEAPALVDEAPAAAIFPRSIASKTDAELERAEQGFVSWRARLPVTALANPKMKLVAEAGESESDFLERCLEAADRADDAAQDRARRRFEARMRTLTKRLEREQDELARDQEQLKSRKAEEILGAVEGLFSVLLGSRSVRSASSKAASRMKTAAGKRRMRQRAAGSVIESEREIERIEAELEELAGELQEEIDNIAAASEIKAAEIEQIAVRPKRADVVVRELTLVWARGGAV
jgi:hypothetical protein